MKRLLFSLTLVFMASSAHATSSSPRTDSSSSSSVGDSTTAETTYGSVFVSDAGSSSSSSFRASTTTEGGTVFFDSTGTIGTTDTTDYYVPVNDVATVNLAYGAALTSFLALGLFYPEPVSNFLCCCAIKGFDGAEWVWNKGKKAFHLVTGPCRRRPLREAQKEE